MLFSGIGKLDRSVAGAWEVRPKWEWEVRPKCFTKKENNYRRRILPVAKEMPKAKYYFIVN